MSDQIQIDNTPTDAISAANAVLAAKKQAKADQRKAQRAAKKAQASDQPSPAQASEQIPPAPAKVDAAPKPLTDAQKCRDILVSNLGKSVDELKALVAPLGVKDSTLTTLRSDVAATMAAARRCGLLIDQAS